MNNTIQNPTLLISLFENEKWVISGVNNETVTSQTHPESVKQFLRKNGVFPGQIASAIKNANVFDWRKKILPPVEHKSENGDDLFTDRGNRITFDREIVTDEEIRLALVHAQQKFGNELTLNGDDMRIKERIAQIADNMGMTILNPELQAGLGKYREDRH